MQNIVKSIARSSWTADPNPEFWPTVYRKGVWSFQAHPAALLALLANWTSLCMLNASTQPTPAIFASSEFASYVLMAAATIGTLFAFGEAGRWVKLLFTWGSKTSYVGIVESSALVGWLCMFYLLMHRPH